LDPRLATPLAQLAVHCDSPARLSKRTFSWRESPFIINNLVNASPNMGIEFLAKMDILGKVLREVLRHIFD